MAYAIQRYGFFSNIASNTNKTQIKNILLLSYKKKADSYRLDAQDTRHTQIIINFATDMKKTMKKKIIIPLTLLVATVALTCILTCRKTSSVSSRITDYSMTTTDKLHPAVNSIYYWRTTFRLSDAERDFLSQHNVKRMYMRMFDVVESGQRYEFQEVPNATIRFEQPVPDGMEVVPTVFVTTEAVMNLEEYGAEYLAQRIVERVTNMCEWNDITNWHELQLDCDWNKNTRINFFMLCKYVKLALPKDIRLSSTIRLHQLVEEAPPVDCGVLMVYNTDSFKAYDTENSILNPNTVEQYLKLGTGYKLPLDIALPAYQWDLIYDDHYLFVEIARDSTDDNPTHIRKHEDVPFSTLQKTQALIDKYMRPKHGHYSTILYHLSEQNLNKYSNEQIDEIYNH